MNEQLFTDLNCEDLMPVMSNLANNDSCFYLPMDNDPKTITAINRFMRQVILDGHIRIGKVVGFGVRAGIVDTAPKGYLPGIREDIFQLTERFSNLIFKPSAEPDRLFTLSGIRGELTSNELNQFRMMSYNEHYSLCTIYTQHQLDISVSYGTINDHQIQLSKYFTGNSQMIPIHPSFSLSRYVRIMPPRYENGMIYIPIKKTRNIDLASLLDHITDVILKTESNTVMISYNIWDIFENVMRSECSKYYKKGVEPLKNGMIRYLVDNTEGRWERMRQTEPKTSKQLQDFEFMHFKNALLGDSMQAVKAKIVAMHPQITLKAMEAIADVLIKYC